MIDNLVLRSRGIPERFTLGRRKRRLGGLCERRSSRTEIRTWSGDGGCSSPVYRSARVGQRSGKRVGGCRVIGVPLQHLFGFILHVRVILL